MADPQKLCAVRVGTNDALIRVRLSRALQNNERFALTLVLQDLSSEKELLAVAETVFKAGDQQADLSFQSAAKGLALAYSLEGFAKLGLRGRAAVGGGVEASAQLVLVGTSHEFPRLPFSLPVPPLDTSAPIALFWIVGRGRPGVAPL